MKIASRTTDTRKQILEVAESHFAQFGYAGTSVRGIIKEAGVNLAAVHYHFQSKEGLYAAVLEQYAKPIVEQQLQDLHDYVERHRKPHVEDVVRIFYTPPLQKTSEDTEKGKIAALLLARCFTEPDEIQSIANKQFDACREAFADAFAMCLPDATKREHLWNVEFMVGAIIAYLMRRNFVEKDTARNLEAAINRLTEFVAGGVKRTARKI